MVLAEGFSRLGVPVFIADVKGDVAGLARRGRRTRRSSSAPPSSASTGYAPRPAPSCSGTSTAGAAIRSAPPSARSARPCWRRMLELNDTQSGVLEIAFKLADDRGLLLLDLDDLRAMLGFVGEHRKEVSAQYGLVSAQSIAAIQRALLSLEREGGEAFFGEPALELADLLRTDLDGRGIVNILAADQLILQAAAVLELPALAALRAVRELAGGRRPRQAEAGVLLRRGAPALRRLAAGAATADRAGRAADPLQGRGRVLLLPVPRRRARRDPRPARQPHPARAARLHAARPEGRAHGRRDLRGQSQGRRRAASSPSSPSARRSSPRFRTEACRCRSSAR